MELAKASTLGKKTKTTAEAKLGGCKNGVRTVGKCGIFKKKLTKYLAESEAVVKNMDKKTESVH